MDVLHRKCAGLEVHEGRVVGGVRVMIGHKVNREAASFGVTARGLIGLGDWLAKHAVTHVGLVATGEGWEPVWYLLAGRFELVLVADVRALRDGGEGEGGGDDARSLADALALGLVRGDVAPPEPLPDLRDMIETREQFARDVVQHGTWIVELLGSCQLKLATVTTDMLGVAGRGILDALIAGEEDPEKLAGLAQGVLRAKRGALVDALPGRILDHHRLLLGQHLRLIENLEQGMASLDEDIDKILAALPDARLETLTA